VLSDDVTNLTSVTRMRSWSQIQPWRKEIRKPSKNCA